MRVGDQIPVTINGIVVANATVESIGSDRASLVIPGTRVVMAIRVQLTDETPQPEKETETIITGVDRVVPETPEVAAESSVSEVPTTDVSTTETSSTPVDAAEVSTESAVGGESNAE